MEESLLGWRSLGWGNCWGRFGCTAQGSLKLTFFTSARVTGAYFNFLFLQKEKTNCCLKPMQFPNVGQLPSLSSRLDTANYALKGCDVAVSASPDRGQVDSCSCLPGEEYIRSKLLTSWEECREEGAASCHTLLEHASKAPSKSSFIKIPLPPNSATLEIKPSAFDHRTSTSKLWHPWETDSIYPISKVILFLILLWKSLVSSKGTGINPQ